MHVSSQKLASRVQECVAPHLPRGFQLRVNNGAVEILVFDDLLSTIVSPQIVEDLDDRTIEEKVVTAVSATLEGIQDAIMRALGEKWPPSRSGELGLPTTVLENGKLQSKFCVGDETVLLLPDIPLREIA